MDLPFFRFPHTPHMAWLGPGLPRDDKVLSHDDVVSLLAAEVTVEEKVDGANIGLSLDSEGKLQVQNRGQYLRAPFKGQFSRLGAWMAKYREPLVRFLRGEFIAFGEWCAATHSIRYDLLPDWFLLFDIYDRRGRCFWSTRRRNELAVSIGVSVVPEIARGHYTSMQLQELLQWPSRVGSDGMEGLVIRSEGADELLSRAKLVRVEFVQEIDRHWRNRPRNWNMLRRSLQNVHSHSE